MWNTGLRLAAGSALRRLYASTSLACPDQPEVYTGISSAPFCRENALALAHSTGFEIVSRSLPIPLATRFYFYLFLLFIPRIESSTTYLSVLCVTLSTKEPGITPLLSCQGSIQSLLLSRWWGNQRQQTAISWVAGGRGRSNIWEITTMQVTSSSKRAFQNPLCVAGPCPVPPVAPTVPPCQLFLPTLRWMPLSSAPSVLEQKWGLFSTPNCQRQQISTMLHSYPERL